MTVKVYRTKGCVQCRSTKRALEKEGIDFEEIILGDDSPLRDQLINEGFSALPVVKTPEGNWSGFRLDRIKNLKES